MSAKGLQRYRFQTRTKSLPAKVALYRAIVKFALFVYELNALNTNMGTNSLLKLLQRGAIFEGPIASVALSNKTK